MPPKVPPKIINDDCLVALPKLTPNSISSVVTDPPYGLKFMGKDWDHGIPGTHYWQEILRVAKPGAYLLAFGGTRTFHRLTCAIEDAGWEIRDCIMWIYGSGFPKSLDVSKAIDKATGKTAKQWDGWGSALKPAFEPIILARKPIDGTIAANVLKWGCGAINIDGCRIPLNGDYKCGANGRPSQTGLGDNYDPAKANQHSNIGRWPANLIHDGSPEVVGMFPSNKDGYYVGKNRDAKKHSGNKIFGKRNSDAKDIGYGGEGSAARFFYCAKAPKTERQGSQHPTVKPLSLMRYLCRLVTPPHGIILDPFMGSGTTGEASLLEGFRFIGIEIDPTYAKEATHRIYKS